MNNVVYLIIRDRALIDASDRTFQLRRAYRHLSLPPEVIVPDYNYGLFWSNLWPNSNLPIKVSEGLGCSAEGMKGCLSKSALINQLTALQPETICVISPFVGEMLGIKIQNMHPGKVVAFVNGSNNNKIVVDHQSLNIINNPEVIEYQM